MRVPESNQTVIASGWPDAEIAAIASRQRTLITHRQLAALGLADSTIWRALKRGRLHRVHRGLYSLVTANVRPALAAEHAAVLVYGARAVLSHQTALGIHGISLSGVDAREIHVTLVGAHRQPRRSGILLHSTARLDPQEHHRRNGLPVTSLARTTLDLMPGLSPRARERLVDEALKKTSRSKLLEELKRHRGRPGTPALLALLEPGRPSSLTWSKAEERLRAAISRTDVPDPESNVALWPGYTPDLLWRDQRVIVEYDSEEHHLGRRPFHHDRTRRNRLTTAGYQVLAITKEHSPEQVLVWIAQALARAESRT